MTPAGFDEACRALMGVTMDVLWGSDQVYKVGGKMFAVLGEAGACSFKANDVAFEMLVETGAAKPAPYMARAKWLYLDTLGALPDADLRQYLAHAHALVAAKLTGKARREIGIA